MLPYALRLPLFALVLVAVLGACAAGRPATADTPSTPSARIAPRIPEQVSNAAWETDMQRFAAEVMPLVDA